MNSYFFKINKKIRELSAIIHHKIVNKTACPFLNLIFAFSSDLLLLESY